MSPGGCFIPGEHLDQYRGLSLRSVGGNSTHDQHVIPYRIWGPIGGYDQLGGCAPLGRVARIHKYIIHPQLDTVQASILTSRGMDNDPVASPRLFMVDRRMDQHQRSGIEGASTRLKIHQRSC